ncbi:MAG: chemotaxis protein CheW [Chitinophagaceae bacterium]|nr:chemotaxis protein CheW [Oligoflexus sp.]
MENFGTFDEDESAPASILPTAGFGTFDDSESESGAEVTRTPPALLNDENHASKIDSKGLAAAPREKEPTASEAPNFLTVLLCRKSGQRFAVPVAQVKEVYGQLDLKPLPMRVENISGVISVNGAIVAVVDDNCAFDGTEIETAGIQPTFIVCEVDGHHLAIRVEEASQVVDIKTSEIRTLASKKNASPASVSSITNFEGETLLFLDVKAMVKKIEKNQDV